MQIFHTGINVDYSINSGQVFLWQKENDTWFGINGKNVLAIKDNPLVIDSMLEEKTDFFRKNDNMETILHDITSDKLVRHAVQKFPGLRLLRQEPFQCYISFIVSSNSSIQNIRQTLFKLCKKFGEHVSFQGKDFWLFPDPKTFATSKINELLKCGLGYRAKAVKEAAKAVYSGRINFETLKKDDYHSAKYELLKIYGIGDKVADCIMLFSLEKLDAFPLDRWTLRILQKYYSDKFQLTGKSLTSKKYSELHKEIVEFFGPYAGYSQQFLFRMERDINEKNWL